MRAAAIAVVIVLVVAAPAAASQSEERAALMRTGTIKLWLGAALAGAGAVVIPATAAHRQPRARPLTPIMGVGLLSAGGSLIWLGVRDQRRAVQPATTVTVIVGRERGIQIRRSW